MLVVNERICGECSTRELCTSSVRTEHNRKVVAFQDAQNNCTLRVDKAVYREDAEQLLHDRPGRGGSRHSLGTHLPTLSSGRERFLIHVNSYTKFQYR